MKTILVIGASKGIGKAVCRAVVARGLAVRAMSRSGADPVETAPACEPFKGDARDGADLARALTGVDAVVQALGVAPSFKRTLEPVTLFSQSTEALLPAMKDAAVGRLVAVTGFGAGDSRQSIAPYQRPPFELLLGRAYDDKSAQEAMIEQSDLDWLIVRPGTLTNGPATGQYRVLADPGAWRNGFVSREDVADFIAARLVADRFGRQKPVIIRYPLPNFA